jgi:hypothetical protein
MWAPIGQQQSMLQMNQTHLLQSKLLKLALTALLHQLQKLY